MRRQLDGTSNPAQANGASALGNGASAQANPASAQAIIRRSIRLRRWACLLTLALTVSWASAEQLIGPVQNTMQFPAVGVTPQGFTATVDIAHQDIVGTVPVAITVTSTTRFTADRNLVFRFEPLAGGRTPPQNAMMIDVPLMAPQGSTANRFQRYLPKWAAGHSYRVTIRESGQPLDGYESVVGNSVMQGRDPNLALLAREVSADWIYIGELDSNGARPPVVDQLYDIASAQARPKRGLLGVAGGVNLTTLPPGELPTDWRAYQRYDMVIVTDTSLSKLREKRDKFEAVHDWLLTGGVILMLDPDSPEAFSRELEFLWTDDDGPRRAVARTAAELLTKKSEQLESWGMRKADLETFLSQAEVQPQVLTMSRPPPTASQIANAKDELKALQELLLDDANTRRAHRWANYSVNDWTEQIWFQPVGAGLIVGMRTENGLVSPMHWAIAGKKLSYRKSPTLRRGVDPLIGDYRFTRWMISGVAEPPVYTFIGLLTLFVILVGPIAYRRTTRHGRGYLMFAIAPFLAMVTTLAMFGYGILADGFGTVARVRQVTWIDGATGDAGERVRSTYFAGVRPANGLHFPAQAEVISYPEGQGKSWNELNELDSAITGRVQINSHDQVFDQSFLPSRQQRQFVTHQPRRKAGTVSLVMGDDGVLQIVSTLDFSLERVVVRDRQGAYWLVDDLPADGAVAATSLRDDKVSAILGKMYNDHRPQSRVREAKQRRNPREVRDLISRIERTLDDSSKVNEGTHEFWLNDQLSLRGHIPEQYFIAVTNVSEDVIAVEETELVDSVRYVFGTTP